jgi:hypothetical protein
MLRLNGPQLSRLRNTRISFSWYDEPHLWIDDGINGVPAATVFPED